MVWRQFHQVRVVFVVFSFTLGMWQSMAGAETKLSAMINAPDIRHKPTRDDVVTLVLVGDTGFAPSGAPVRSNGVSKKGRWQDWSDTTSRIISDIDGNINFLNVETVVTNRNNLTADQKASRRPYHFRTHPNGMRHLVKVGFNVFSLANNHSMDYGQAGLLETLRHVGKLSKHGLLADAGIGLNREAASRPKQDPH